jgi:putative transposase
MRNEGHTVNQKPIRRLMRLMPVFQKPDITYLPMRKGFFYLVAIMDWHTRKVLA